MTLVQTKKLQYWKSEHKDLNGCQDACELDAERGLFAVADGAGTTLFPALWARILARHFIDIPLMSDDPFEVEWWVRLAQDQYKARIPDMEQLLDWSVRQKAQNQGSDSTLATVRIAALDPVSSSALAELLVFGDSCVIIGNKETSKIEKSFVLQTAADFNQAPICVPSTLKFFNRNFHRCSITSFSLQSHHIVMLATDAVARWILGGGSGGSRHVEVWDAFHEVYRLSENDWPGFIEECRKRKEMVDDDSTALILTFRKDEHGDGIPLGITTTHDHLVVRGDTVIDVIKERKEAFQKAQQEKNNELVAIDYGDGMDLKPLVDVADEEIRHAREVANALKEVLRAFRQAQNTSGLAAKVEPVWRQYGSLLQNERCADNIRETLQRNGVNLALPGQSAPSQPASASTSNVIPPMIGLPSQPGDPQSIHMQQATAGKLSGEVPDEREKKDLEFNFLRAFHEKPDDDDVILAAAEAIEAARSRYLDLLQFKPEQEKRIAQARKRKHMQANLQKALQSGLVEEIATAYDPTLIDEQILSPDERTRIELACRLAEACRNEDDDVTVKIYEQIMFSAHQKSFTFTLEDQKRLTDARRRIRASEIFRAALTSRNLQQIVNAYEPVLNDTRYLDVRDQELLELAQYFIVAYHAGDDDALVDTYQKIMKSHSQFITFTEEERNRIKRAEMGIQTIISNRKTAVATVGDQQITLEWLRKVCTIKDLYIRYKIGGFQGSLRDDTDSDTRQEIERQIAYLTTEIDPLQLPNFALDDIIDDILIKERIAEEQGQGIPMDDFDVEGQFPDFFEEFRKYAVADYDALLKSSRLTHDDVAEILYIYLRRELFPIHFQNQQKSVKPKLWWQKPKTVNEWLEKQRKDAGVIYTEFNSDPYQRGLWLLEQLRWIK